MRRLIPSFLRCRVAAFSVVLCVATANPASAGQPTVTITYGETFDSLCSLVRGGKIQDSWKKELLALQPQFGGLWMEHGPAMITAAEAITGKPFPDDDVTVRLTLCDVPSQSWVGISINMRFALGTYTQMPVPLRYKVYTAFHELLHHFLSEHEVEDSALLAQLPAEPARVRDHLHLLALQKAVLLQLGESGALQEIITIDSQLPDGYYKRAWEIVNATPATYEQYVAEITQ